MSQLLLAGIVGLIGKKYLHSGLDDLLIESGVYAARTTAALMKGKSYNRGVRAHKLVSEAMFRLMWSAFVEWPVPMMSA